MIDEDNRDNDLRIANYAWYLEYWDVAHNLEAAMYQDDYEEKFLFLQTARALVPGDAPKGKEVEHQWLLDGIDGVIVWLEGRAEAKRAAAE